MRLNEDIAEVIGAFIGDGCISTYKENGRERTVVLFTGHWKNDRAYYLTKLVPIIRKKFGGFRKTYHRIDDNTIRYVLCDKKIIRFFKKMGMPIGEKENLIRVPIEISSNKRCTKACIRGIFNTDGSVYSRYSKQYTGHARLYRSYAVVQFKMKSNEVILWIKKQLEDLGIKVNRTTKVLNCNIIRITDQDSVKKFFGEIGFTHPYHKKRYMEIITRA